MPNLRKHILAFSILLVLMSIRSLIVSASPYTGLSWDELWTDDALVWLPFSLGVISVIIGHEFMHFITAKLFKASPAFCFMWRWLLPCPAVRYDETRLTSNQERLIFVAPQLITLGILISAFLVQDTALLYSLLFTHLFVSVFDFSEFILSYRVSAKTSSFVLTLTFGPVVGLFLFVILHEVMSSLLGSVWAGVAAGVIALVAAVLLPNKTAAILLNFFWFVPLVIIMRLVRKRWVSGFEISPARKLEYVDRFRDIWT